MSSQIYIGWVSLRIKVVRAKIEGNKAHGRPTNRQIDLRKKLMKYRKIKLKLE